MVNEQYTQLDNVDVLHCEGIVSLEETTEALKKLETGSAPGSDGITCEF